ncbi:hypothetical protein [Actinomadura violacea]|uniref:Uncharacterized protein n=1 Tax=Actinomadura violacea TaxID=2819934 RepID=A0ABS3RXT1_9ACTN|nr:hypothetical protein [Actinomadura violacea]MBO2461570.1 hypothetical protein [Actinomadura violacea]
MKYVIHALQEDSPDDQLVQQALDALTSIRDGMAQGDMFMDLFRDVRDHLVAVLGHNTDLTGQVIGDAAGVNDSYVSRVTRKIMGSTRREHRRAKRARRGGQRADPPSPPVMHRRTPAAS